MLEDGGPEAVSVEATATALGISRATLYRMYPSKDDLVWMVLDRASLELDGAARAILRNPNLTPRERVEHLLRMQLEVAVRRPRSLFVLLCGRDLPTEKADRLQIWRDTYDRRWLRAIQAAIKSNDLPAEEPQVIVCLIAGITIAAASRRPSSDGALQHLVYAALGLVLRPPCTCSNACYHCT